MECHCGIDYVLRFEVHAQMRLRSWHCAFVHPQIGTQLLIVVGRRFVSISGTFKDLYCDDVIIKLFTIQFVYVRSPTHGGMLCDANR